MKKEMIPLTIAAALMLSLPGCGKARDAKQEKPAAEPQVTADVQTPAPEGAVENTQSAPESAETPAFPARQDGERFEDVIVLEGMEETVSYEHFRNESLGLEMDYDYEMFVRRTEPDREIILSSWDDPASPENYLELRADTGNADLVADAIAATLSQEYDIYSDYRELERAGRCRFIAAEVIKGTNQMAEHLQEVYVIPAPDGCRVAVMHAFIADSEGFFRRLSYMLNTLTVFDRGIAAEPVTDEMALSGIVGYCTYNNPDLEAIVNAGEYPTYWEIVSSDEQQVVVLFRSYTGSQTRYYIDRATGDAYVTEFVPGITPEEMRSEETLNIWDYVGG